MKCEYNNLDDYFSIMRSVLALGWYNTCPLKRLICWIIHTKGACFVLYSAAQGVFHCSVLDGILCLERLRCGMPGEFFVTKIDSRFSVLGRQNKGNKEIVS